jgi:hypothetical protein
VEWSTSTVAAVRSSSTSGGEWHSCIERPSWQHMSRRAAQRASRTVRLAAQRSSLQQPSGWRALASAGRRMVTSCKRADGDLGQVDCGLDGWVDGDLRWVDGDLARAGGTTATSAGGQNTEPPSRVRWSTIAELCLPTDSGDFYIVCCLLPPLEHLAQTVAS